MAQHNLGLHYAATESAEEAVTEAEKNTPR
jgi:hypothetical protein